MNTIISILFVAGAVVFVIIPVVKHFILPLFSKKKPCAACRELYTKRIIDSDGALAKTYRVIRGNLADGTLSGELSEDAPGYHPGIDTFDKTFHCAHCKMQFRLHGTTGERGVSVCWEPVDYDERFDELSSK